MSDTSLFGRTILIVDDDPFWAQVAARIFQTADFTTHIAANCTAAINYLQTTMPDCVLLDFYMPGQNGGMVADYIRNDEKLKKTPLIIVSADETLAKAAHYACKVDSFVVKSNDTRKKR